MVTGSDSASVYRVPRMSNARSRTLDSSARRFAAAGTTAAAVSDSGYDAADCSRAAKSYPARSEVPTTAARITLSIWAQITPLMREMNTHALNPARGCSAERVMSRGDTRNSGHSRRAATA